MKYLTALLLIIALCSISCKIMAKKSPGKTKLEFTEIKAGSYSGLEERREIVINDPMEFGRLWKQMFSIYHPMPVIPEIDFTNYTLVGLSIGTMSTGGHSVEIVEIHETSDKVEIIFKTSSPAPDDYVTMALTQPYHLVIIPKTSKNIFFKAYHLMER